MHLYTPRQYIPCRNNLCMWLPDKKTAFLTFRISLCLSLSVLLSTKVICRGPVCSVKTSLSNCLGPLLGLLVTESGCIGMEEKEKPNMIHLVALHLKWAFPS